MSGAIYANGRVGRALDGGLPERSWSGDGRWHGRPWPPPLLKSESCQEESSRIHDSVNHSGLSHFHQAAEHPFLCLRTNLDPLLLVVRDYFLLDIVGREGAAGMTRCGFLGYRQVEVSPEGGGRWAWRHRFYHRQMIKRGRGVQYTCIQCLSPGRPKQMLKNMKCACLLSYCVLCLCQPGPDRRTERCRQERRCKLRRR